GSNLTISYGETNMAVTILGIGLIKNGVALHEAAHKGNIVLCKPKMSRAKLLETLAVLAQT
ncbi:hypothetical protein ACMU90_003434, partial [Vibrio cholerae]